MGCVQLVLSAAHPAQQEFAGNCTLALVSPMQLDADPFISHHVEAEVAFSPARIFIKQHLFLRTSRRHVGLARCCQTTRGSDAHVAYILLTSRHALVVKIRPTPDYAMQKEIER